MKKLLASASLFLLAACGSYMDVDVFVNEDGTRYLITCERANLNDRVIDENCVVEELP